MTQIKRDINNDKVVDIANSLLSKVDDVFDLPEFPKSFTPAEFAIASILMAKEIEKRVNPMSVPSAIYLDEFTKSYTEFIRLINAENNVQ